MRVRVRICVWEWLGTDSVCTQEVDEGVKKLLKQQETATAPHKVRGARSAVCPSLSRSRLALILN